MFYKDIFPKIVIKLINTVISMNTERNMGLSHKTLRSICFNCFRLPFHKLPYDAKQRCDSIPPTEQNRHQLVFVPYNPLVIQYLPRKSSHRRVKQDCVRKMVFVGGWSVGE